MKLFYRLTASVDNDNDLSDLSFEDPEILQGTPEEIAKALISQLFQLASIVEDNPEIYNELSSKYLGNFNQIKEIYNLD